MPKSLEPSDAEAAHMPEGFKGGSTTVMRAWPIVPKYYLVSALGLEPRTP
jgi:hypothetical protein